MFVIIFAPEIGGILSWDGYLVLCRFSKLVFSALWLRELRATVEVVFYCWIFPMIYYVGGAVIEESGIKAKFVLVALELFLASN